YVIRGREGQRPVGAGNDSGTIKHLGQVRDIQSMDAVNPSGWRIANLGLRYQVKSIAGCIDNWCSENSNKWVNGAAMLTTEVSAVNRKFTRLKKTGKQELSTSGAFAIRVKRVNTIVLRHDVNDRCIHLPINAHVGHDQRLRIDLRID